MIYNCSQINTDNYHPEQKWMCRIDLTLYKFEIGYGRTKQDAKEAVKRKLRMKSIKEITIKL